MLKKYRRFMILGIMTICMLLCGCTNRNFTAEVSKGESVFNEDSGDPDFSSPRIVTPEEAKTLFDSSLYLLIDVREQEEYDSGHISGAICIPYTEIENSGDRLPSDKDTMIFVYCRSGRRSAIAAQTLSDMGYQVVLDLGGIIDWPYETVTEEIDEAIEAGSESADAVEAKEEEAETSETAEHEHQWKAYDCTNDICSICGKIRHH